MKHLFQLSALLICSYSFAQTKPAGKPYLKLTPALVFVKDLGPTPSFFMGFGGHISRYAALGISGGYLKFKGASDPVIPLGLDFTVTDFKAKKVQPVVTIQTYYPIYGESTSATSRSGTSSASISSETNGQFMFNIGGGLAALISKKKKFFLTCSYGQLMMRNAVTTQSTTSGRVVTSKTYNNSVTEMITVAITFML